MGDFLTKLLEFIEFLWPFTRIEQWEQGGLYVFGRFKGIKKPGIHFRLPWFMHYEVRSVVPAIVSTPRLDITLRDGSVLSFVASAWCQVTNLAKALNDVEGFAETAVEAISAVLAERIAEAEPERLLPGNRGRLISDLRRWVNAETEVFGVTVEKLRFATFVLKPRIWRVLQDLSHATTW